MAQFTSMNVAKRLHVGSEVVAAGKLARMFVHTIMYPLNIRNPIVPGAIKIAVMHFTRKRYCCSSIACEAARQCLEHARQHPAHDATVTTHSIQQQVWSDCGRKQFPACKLYAGSLGDHGCPFCLLRYCVSDGLHPNLSILRYLAGRQSERAAPVSAMPLSVVNLGPRLVVDMLRWSVTHGIAAVLSVCNKSSLKPETQNAPETW